MKNFFAKLGEKIKANKKKTIVISVISFVLICAIISICCLSAFLFNRFSDGYIPTDAQVEAMKGQYKRVVIIGVDGVGDYFSKTYTPNFDKMFSDKKIGDTQINASVTYTGVSVYPTISCENWMSMFHGVRPVYHGFIFRSTNQRVERGEHTDEEKYPSFVGRYLAENPNGKVLSVCTWRGVNNGIIEDDERITKYNSYPDDIKQFLENYNEDTRTSSNIMTVVDASEEEKVATTVSDNIAGIEGQLYEYLSDHVEQYGYSDETIEMRDAMTMQRVITETVTNPDKYQIAYMHLDQVDHAGHSFGYGKPGYVNAVSRVDMLIGRLYDAYEAAGMLEDTLFVLCTDHGHRLPGGHKNHGKNTDLEVNVTFALAGKTIKSGTPDKYVETDMAAIISYALGVKAAESWQGRVPYGMFLGE
ncbi:MAG: alkaline phosphatase family protein [Clostridia bacterium]|nr:alkaline phosphatase family protein [Clostridia bacterium]